MTVFKCKSSKVPSTPNYTSVKYSMYLATLHLRSSKSQESSHLSSRKPRTSWKTFTIWKMSIEKWLLKRRASALIDVLLCHLSAKLHLFPFLLHWSTGDRWRQREPLQTSRGGFRPPGLSDTGGCTSGSLLAGRTSEAFPLLVVSLINSLCSYHITTLKVLPFLSISLWIHVYDNFHYFSDL